MSNVAQRAQETLAQLVTETPLSERLAAARAFFVSLEQSDLASLKSATQERFFGVRNSNAATEEFAIDCALVIAAMFEEWGGGLTDKQAVA
jgi:hypothetical protein